MFRPDLLGEECEGIHEVLMYAITKSDMDLRKILYQNIVLSGGSTLLKGFGDRLLLELKKNLPKDLKIRVCSTFIKPTENIELRPHFKYNFHFN